MPACPPGLLRDRVIGYRARSGEKIVASIGKRASTTDTTKAQKKLIGIP
jgi:hypothetical protein